MSETTKRTTSCRDFLKHTGRMSAHTGQTITFEEMLNFAHELAPDVDKLTMDSPAPLQLESNGKYPCPMPGLKTKREY